VTSQVAEPNEIIVVGKCESQNFEIEFKLCLDSDTDFLVLHYENYQITPFPLHSTLQHTQDIEIILIGNACTK
jgi:hypothetical protein